MSVATAAPGPPLHLHFRYMAPRLMDIRTRLPAEALAKEPGIVVTEGLSVALRSLPASTPKLVITQRQSAGDELDWLAGSARMIRAGWLSLMEYDDHPKLTFAVHNRTLDEAAWRHFSQFHGIQTSTEPLAKLFRAWNPEVAVFPNAVFELPPLPPTSRGHPPRLFYGAISRTEMGIEMMGSLAGVLAAHPEAAVAVVGDRAVFDAVPTRNKLFKGYLSFEDYNRLMAMCDISLAPLGDDEGLECKSDAKFLDGARNGAVTIASPNVYAQTIVDGVTGFIAREPGDWARILASLLDDPALRARVAANAWDYVRRERMFAYQIPARRDWYMSLWARRHELTRKLAERAPALMAMLTAQPPR